VTHYRFGVVLIDNDGEVLISLGHLNGPRNPAEWMSCGWPVGSEADTLLLETRPDPYLINTGGRYQVQEETL